MQATALDTAPALRGSATLLRLQGDERLVALTRRGNQVAYEVLVQRYQARLLAFCRHMLGSKEDAEDVLQEVFANAFNAINGDDRAINVRPWLYRIARNRCLNHLRKIQPIGVDTMDDRVADHGTSAADTAHRRQEFRDLLEDVRALAETQRTALLLREIDALSYEQIAEAMDTTVPSVKSLLVRARVGLAEASEARNLTCEEVRDELGEVSESLTRLSPPVRRHVKECERCAAFQTHLKSNNRALTAVMPIGPLVLLKKLLAHLTAGFGASGGAAVGTVAASSVTGGVLTTGVTAIAGKTAAGLAAAAIVTAGAVEVDSAHNRYSATAGQLNVQPAIRAAAPVAAPAVNVVPTPPAKADPAPPSSGSDQSGGLNASVATTTDERSGTTETTTSATRSTTTEAPTDTTTASSTTTGPLPAAPPATTTTPVPVAPTTTVAPAAPVAPPVDTKEQTVTLPAPTTTAPGPTTSTAPTGTTPKPESTTGTTTGAATPAPPARPTKRPARKKRRVPSTSGTVTVAPPVPTPTPGSNGQLPAAPLTTTQP